MKLLAIETSCDETAASVVEKNPTDSFVTLHSNVVSTSLKLHAKTGGIIPEVAAREQLKYIIPVIERALSDANIEKGDIDAIAVTIGPGLIGSLLIGVETAKALAFAWKKEIIPVNHLYGHIYANWISTMNHEPITINFPALALIVSGGHTDLVLMKDHGDIQWLGGTRDDAAGEAFDKIGRMLNFPYPSGPTIEEKAKLGNPKRFNFPRPMMGSNDFDFSFSGLKAAVFREIQKINPTMNHELLTNNDVNDFCAGTQRAIIAVLVKKTLRAAEKYNVKSILLGGGVAANGSLVNELKVRTQELGVELFVPKKSLCTDNAAMIGAAAFYTSEPKAWNEINADPELYFE